MPFWNPFQEGIFNCAAAGPGGMDICRLRFYNSTGAARRSRLISSVTARGDMESMNVFSRVKNVALTAIVVVILAGAAARAASIAPAYENVSYGAHERAVLDFWKADSAKPAPLVIYIHGGGFISGDKGLASDEAIKKCLASGVSYASISYPYYTDVALHEIIRDNIARAVQFLKYKSADWNIDKTKIAVYGQSAGAGSSLWIAFHDDIADPGSADPVLRESSRVAAAGALATQATYDLPAWENVFIGAVDKRVARGWRVMMTPTMLDMYHLKSEKQLNSPDSLEMRRDLDMLAMIDKSDPPVCMKTMASELRDGDMLHHPRHPGAVKEKCDSAGADCSLVLDSTPADKMIDMVDFLIAHIK